MCMARTLDGLRWNDAQREWGAAVSLQLYSVRGEERVPFDSTLFGPFDVWDGEWWRIPVSAFHHADLLHLLMNMSAAWFFGSRLERQWGSFRYLIFLFPAVLFPILAEFAVGHTAVGFSGAICAIFGAHLAMRRLADDRTLNDFVVRCTMAFLVLCLWSNALGLTRIANVAHFAGLSYGFIAASVMCGQMTGSALWKAIFIMAHTVALPILDYVMTPVDCGRYHWYTAEHKPGPLERVHRLQKAVTCDPLLAGAWRRLADEQLPDYSMAWETLLEGLSHDPTDVELIEAVRRVWRRIPTGIARSHAEDELKRIFGERAGAWRHQIRQVSQVDAKPEIETAPEAPPPVVDEKLYRLDRKIDLDWAPASPQQQVVPPVNPNADNSAGEGTSI